MRKDKIALRVACLLLAAVICGSATNFSWASPATRDTDAADDASGANWPAYGRTYSSDHFSPLAQISDANVPRLGLAWHIDIPTQISAHSAPLEVDGVIYYSTGFSLIHAVTATTGTELWRYDPDVTAVAGDKLRSAWGSRGIAFWQDKVFAGTQDGRLIAINAKSGKLVWSVQTTEGARDGRYITGAPLVFDGKVLIGHGGADFGPVRGYVTAYDAQSGAKVWRFFTVPGKPGVSDGAASDDVMPMAAKTWKGHWWKYGGGGTAWNALTYDPEFDRLYIGTGNGYPWNRNIRSPGGGDNLFLCSIVALDAKTGRYLWHYQTTPGESWDFNSAMDIELATLQIAGASRRVILHAPKNGFFYVIDRDTGKLISAQPFVKVTWASRVDLATGRPIENPLARFPTGETVIQPAGTGAHNWMAMSYDPSTKLVYVPTLEMAGYYSQKGIDLKRWKPPARIALDTGFDPPLSGTIEALPAASSKPIGALQAWDPVAQKARWSVPLLGPYNGGVLSTAGNLVLEGNASGQFVAYAADTGKKLWVFNAQDGIVAQPITFSVDGKQYITVMTGYSSIASAVGPASAQFGWSYRTQSRRLLTFALDGTDRLPEPMSKEAIAIIDDPAPIERASALRGSAIFGRAGCLSCHGVGAVASGGAPDLRASTIPLSSEAFRQVVKNGALSSRGMPKFDEISDVDLDALRAYIRYEARIAVHPALGSISPRTQ